MISALGQARSEVPDRYLIKLDAWHIRRLPLFRAAFPDVPWIFTYRDPAEVLVVDPAGPAGEPRSYGSFDPRNAA
jgi:hypothetical protein